ncbi:MAG: mechanosensitive ion channel [Clostridia bacterium]|nr:mechanosensitive ion channel [Clostridia bacterium]
MKRNIMELKNLIFEFFCSYGKSILISLIVLFAGLFGLKKLSKILMLVLRKSSLGANISGLLNYIIKFLIYYPIVFFILDQFGVNAWNVIAPLGASIVALSVIFKDGISNFISGVFIFMNQTFRPGDYIELSSVKGTVVQIKYFYTIIYTDDSKSAIIPNSKIASEIICRKATDNISPLKLILKITNKNSSENLNSKELESIKKILEKSLILHSKNILESPSPSFSISKDSSEINILVWSLSSNFENILLSFDNLIKNRLKDFNVDLSSDCKL